MSSKTEKKTLLHQLSLELEPISLYDLAEKVGGQFKERSIRRWLAELVEAGYVEKIGQKRATKYRAIQQAHPSEIRQPVKCFGGESSKIIEKIKRAPFERKPVAYADEWLMSYQPNISSYLPMNIRMKLQQSGQRSKREEPAGTYAHQIFNRLLIDLSYNSSRLEGNTYSLLDTEKLLLEGASAEGKLDEEKIMILNHKEAIRYMVDNAPKLEIAEQTIFTIHYLLSDGLLESRYTGKIRDHGVHIGGSTYLPFEDKRDLEKRFKIILEKGSAIENSYEQSLFLLAHLSYLQAFADVNKRTARLSANIPLIKSNLVPLSFNDVGKDDYISAMIAIYELQEIGPLCDLYLFSYLRTCALYDSTIKAIGFDEIRVRYRQQRRVLIREIILNKLTGEGLHAFLAGQGALIKKEDRSDFIEDVMEDLKEIDQSRIAGLGITSQDLNAWLSLR